MKKLIELLQSVVSHRPETPPPLADPAPAAGAAAAPHPLSSFAQVRSRVLQALGQDGPPREAATLMASELETYGRDVLKPWIASSATGAADAEIAAQLVAGGEAEILRSLVAQPGDPAAFTPAMILRQIESELAETLQIADAQPTA